MKKILIVKPLLTEVRYHFSYSQELEKYYDVKWIIGAYKHYNDQKKSDNIFLVCAKNENHKFNVIDEIKFSIKVVIHLLKNNYDLVYIHSHRLAFIYKIVCPKNNYVLQMFSPAVCRNVVKRFINNNLEKRFSTFFYNDIFLLTDWMKNNFNLKNKNIYINGWGNSVLSKTKKVFDENRNIHLVYIGTLQNRKIHKTIYGLKKFVDENNNYSSISYEIIGKGPQFDVDLLLKAINDTCLNEIITYHGYLNDSELLPIIDKCNVGVAFVPITEYFNNNVVTKTFEYLLSGIPVIATDTYENRKIIFENNGVLILDSADGFNKGLIQILKSFTKYDSRIIRESVSEFTYENFVKDKVRPIFDKIIASKKV